MSVRRIITFAFVFAIVALTVGLSGCEKIAPMVPDDTTTMPPMIDGEIPIGVAVALTGEYAEPYGIPMRDGLELARKEINMLGGPSLMFVPADPQSTVEGGMAAVQQLVDQGVPAIVGIGISTHLEQAFPIAEENGVVAFSPISSASGLSALGDYIFRTGLTVGVLNSNGAMVAHEKLGYKKAALIYDAADTYSTSSNEAFQTTLEAIGVEILTVETFQTGDTDFSTQLTNIKGMEPDSLFISALAPEMTQIITQARDKDNGIPDSVRLFVPDLTMKEIQEVGDAAEGAITFSGWDGMADTPGNQAFVQNYKAAYGSEPGPWAAQAYATLHILANAIMNAQSTDSTAIRDALAQTMDFPTILGNFSFDPDGDAVYDPIVFIVKDGELQLFETAVPQTMHKEIPIGLVVPLTGSNAGPYGLSMQNGFELAREEINNTTLLGDASLTFMTEDSRTTEEGTIDAVQMFVDQGLPAIIGLASSAQLKKAYPIAHESGVVVFSSLSAEAGLGALRDFLFRTGLATDILIPAGVMATQEKLGYKKAALIYDADDDYSISSYRQVKAALETNGVEIVGTETFQTGDTDFSAQLTNIMGMVPDTLFISALVPEMIQIITQARSPEIGIPDAVRLIIPDLTAKEIQEVGDAAEGAITFSGWFGMADTPGNQAFVQNYEAEYGIEPGPWAAQAYATLHILANAIMNAQSTDSAAIRDALAQTMDFSTILGDFSFDPDGEAVYDPIVFVVKDGELQVFE